ncbi:hypothetical protein Taro_017179 [Colocasia esculenta]|uniref:Uncharacterized protein n=1 Tax=Colocasia esculenta TaxID=4460 RepID=A0A843UFL9_COLES|nr:hypothetical protein [Colocasia esculenta]
MRAIRHALGGLLTSGLKRRRPPTSHLGCDVGLRRVLNCNAFLRNPGQTKLSQALLDQGELLRGSFGRLEVLEMCGACSRREDVAWSGGNAERSPVFAFFVKVFEGKNEVRLLSLGRLRSRKTRIHISVLLKRRRQGHCRVQEGALASVAFRSKEGDTASVSLPGSQPSMSTSLRRLPWWRSRFVSALLVWVRRRHPPRRNQRSDAGYVAIRLGCLSNLERLSPSMESFLNPIYNSENPDAAFHNPQDYEESLPHDLFDEVARPWVATVHTSEGRHRDEGSPSRNTHPPQSDDQAAQLLRLIP